MMIFKIGSKMVKLAPKWLVSSKWTSLTTLISLHNERVIHPPERFLTHLEGWVVRYHSNCFGKLHLAESIRNQLQYHLLFLGLLLGQKHTKIKTYINTMRARKHGNGR